MKMYHRDVFMPRGIRKQFTQLKCDASTVHYFEYSQHAKNAAQNDRFGQIELTSRLTLDTMELIEVEHDGNKIVKVVIREVGQEKNRVWAIIPTGRGKWLVKTVWINLANDKHRTLNVTPYEQKKS
jgi:hypothetical protein